MSADARAAEGGESFETMVPTLGEAAAM